MAAKIANHSRRSFRRRITQAVVVAAGPMLGFSLLGAAPASAVDVGVVVNTPNGGNARVRDQASLDGRVLYVLADGTPLRNAECTERAADTVVWVRLADGGYIHADMTDLATRLPKCDDLPSIAPQAVEQYGGPELVPCYSNGVGQYRHAHLTAPALVLESYAEDEWSDPIDVDLPSSFPIPDKVKGGMRTALKTAQRLFKVIDSFQYKTIHKTIRAEKCDPESGLMVSMRTEYTETVLRFGVSSPVGDGFAPVPWIHPTVASSAIPHGWEYLTLELSKVIATHDHGCANPTCVPI